MYSCMFIILDKEINMKKETTVFDGKVIITPLLNAQKAFNGGLSKAKNKLEKDLFSFKQK